jgi:release factor glutamine methyltransferase
MSSHHKDVFFGKHRFLVSANVYEPAEDSFLIASHLKVPEDARVLDMGTGCGILAILASEKASKVVAVDISPEAVRCARMNTEMSGLGRVIDVRLGNLFQAIEKSESFDLILFNAPYLPTENDEDNGWLAKAWNGGRSGRSIIDQFIDKAPEHLARGGCILTVQSTLSNVKVTLDHFFQHGLCSSVVDRRKMDFESIVLIEAH